MAETFTLKTEKFEGPLDLLLNLIEEKKLHISEVSLAQVADDYLAFLKEQPAVAKKDLADFLIIASTLMFIKSAALLPGLEKTEEETANIEDLKRRLIIYRRFKELSQQIKKLYGHQPIFYRQTDRDIKPVFTPTLEINQNNLLVSARRVIEALPKLEKIREVVVRKTISLEAVIKDLTKRIETSLKLRFSDFIGKNKQEKIRVIVSFLGVLELVRQGIIQVRQNKPFEEIDLETKNPGLPRYSD